jgi:O-antigen/teichoic acid export membrane protein
MLARLREFLLHNKNTKQTIAKNTIWLSAGQIVSRLIRAIIIIYAARILGSSNYGVFTYALSLAAFFTIFVDIGINQITTREASKNHDLKQHYLATTLVIKLILIILTALLIIFIAPSFASIEKAKPLLLLVAILISFESLRDYGYAVVRSIEKMQIEAGVNILINSGIVVLGLTALLFKSNIELLILSFVIGTGIGTTTLFWLIRHQLKSTFVNFRISLIKPLARSSWPFAIMAAMAAVTTNADIIILGWFRTPTEIGWYAAAQKPVQLLYLLPNLIAVSIFPTLSRLAHNDNESLRKILEKAIHFVFLICIPLMFGGMVLAPEIINFLYGADYVAAVIPFAILLITIVFNYPIVLISYAIFAYDKQKIMAIYSSLAAVMTLILNLLMIPNFGIIGAAVVSLSIQALRNTLVWLSLKRISNFTFWNCLPKILLASSIMLLIVWLLKLTGFNLFINISFSVLIYMGMLYLLQESMFLEVSNFIKKLLKTNSPYTF